MTLLRDIRKHSKISSRGFTLLEILITTGIVVGIMFAVGYFGNNLATQNIRINTGILVEQEMHQTLQLMIPEIRSANQSNIGNYPIESAATTSLVFYSDLGGDGTFDRIRYFLDGTTLKKGVIKPTGDPLAYATSSEKMSELVHNMVVSQIFSYYDSSATSTNATALSSPVDVQKINIVRITLVANRGTTSSPSIVGTENQATIRNLRYR